MKAATDAAAAAYKTWRNVGVQHRQRVMLKLQHLIREHTEELAHSITVEQVHKRVNAVRSQEASLRSRDGSFADPSGLVVYRARLWPMPVVMSSAASKSWSTRAVRRP